MLPNHDPVIEAAIRPLADNAEQRQSAASLLSELRSPDDSADAEAIDRWNASDQAKCKPVWRMVLYVVLAIVSAIVIAKGTPTVMVYRVFYSLITGSYNYPKATPPWATQLNDRQKLLLFGDLSQGTQSEQMKGLWDSEPENPAYFAEFARTYHSDNKKLPPNFLATARRIDPENAWFTYLAAVEEGGDCIEKQKLSKAAREAGEAMTYKILDQARLDRSVELLHEAAQQPRCEEYRAAITRERIELLPKTTPRENLRSTLYLMSQPSPDIIALRKLADVICAKGWQDGEQGEVDALKQLISDTDHFNRSLSHMEAIDVVHGLVFKVCAGGTSRELGIAASKLGIEADGRRLGEISRRIIEQRKMRDARPNPIAGRQPGADGGILAAMTIPMLARQVDRPPPLTDADLEPGRLADHEFLSAVSSVACWLLLLIGLGISWLYRFRSSVIIRRLAARMEALMKPVDWIWLIGLGVITPVVYVLAINRLTPLGGRQHGIITGSLLIPAAQLLGLAILIIVISIHAARWRIQQRTAFLTMPRNICWPGWIAIAAAIAFIPCIGLAMNSASNFSLDYEWFGGWKVSEFKSGLFIACGLLAIPLLWLFAVQCRALLGRPARLLHSTLLTRLLVPLYATAMLVMISLAAVFSTASESWSKKDRLMNLDPAFPGLPYEYKVAVQLQKETREVMGYDP